MLPFLQRRWFLLSCALVLLAGTMVDVTRWSITSSRSTYNYGVENGCLHYYWSDPSIIAGSAVPQPGSGVVFGLHRPMLGTFEYSNIPNLFLRLNIPLWLPFSVIIGWIILREIRSRQKRALSADAPGTN
jgi:hypothetical protein